MSELAIVNASPLICLARAGLGHLLQHAGESVVVPLSVSREILARGTHDVTAAFVASSTWLRQVDDPTIPHGILAWDLGAGESAVLAYAHAQLGARAVIDDLQARRCAEALGIPLRGTVGLILRARRLDLIPSAREALNRVRQAGLYLSDRICAEVLREVGEP
jgi:predicted nucleic acid-binding protein